MFGFITDAIKHAHDQTIGRGLDMWQTNYMDRKIQNRTAELNKNFWTYQMSNAYQLTVDDMRKAGLNPMLMMSNGATGAGGHVTSASGYHPQKNDGWQPSQSLVAAKQMKLMNEQIATQKAQTLKTNAEAYESYERTWNAEVQRKIQQAQLPAIEAKAALDAAQAKFLEQYPILWQAAMVGNSASDTLKPFMDGAQMFMDGWLKNKGIDTFGNKQPPNHKPFDHETTFIGSDGKVKSKKRVRYQ